MARGVGGRPALQAAGVEPAGQARRHRLGVLLAEQRVGPVHDVEPGRGRGARGHHRDEEVREALVAPVDDHAAGQRAVGHLALDRRLVGDERARRRCRAAGSRARPPARARARRPTPRSGARAREALPAKAKPRMAAMASGATRQVITAERSRTRRRSSLKVMTNAVSRRAPGPGAVSSPEKLALARRDRAGAGGIRRRWPVRADRRRLGRRRGRHPPRRRAVRGRRGGGARRFLPPGGGLPVPPGGSGRRAVGRPPPPGEPGLARGGHVRAAGQNAAEPPRRVDLPAAERSTGSTCTCRGSMPSTARPCSTSSPSCASSSRPDAEVRQPAWSTELMRGYY